MRLEKVSLGSFKMAKGHYGGWHTSVAPPSPLSLTSLQINTCARTHSITPLSFPPNLKASIPWDPKGKKTTLRATMWKWWRRSQEPGLQTERSMELLDLVLIQRVSHLLWPLGIAFSLQKFQHPPSVKVKGALSLESLGELPDILGGSLSRLADPQARLRAESLGAWRKSPHPSRSPIDWAWSRATPHAGLPEDCFTKPAR